MKNKYISFVALAAAALATSCTSDDLAEQKQNQGEPRTVTLTASVNEVQTRVGMTKNTDNTASFYWHQNDKILVQTKNGSTYSGAEFSTETATGEASASFTGEIGTDYEVGTYAVYPYDSSNQKHEFDASDAKKLTYVLPASYTSYKPESSIFSKDGSYPSNPTNMPMLGTIDGNSIKFKCMGGLAVIRIDKMPATSGTLTVSADQQLSGSFEVADLSVDGAQIATTSESVSDADKKVTFTFSEASTTSAGVFYLPLAVGTYTNVKVTINSTEVDCGRVSISRAGVTAISIATYAGELSTYKDQLLRSYGSSRYYLGSDKYLISGHNFIDLGLNVLWATMNVGADKATDSGNYYAWGETKTKTEYTKSNCEYTATPATLDAAHDAAYVNWGSSCRMPTNGEFGELLANCTWTWDDTNKGHTVTSKKQGYTSNSIFLSASGYYYGSRLSDLNSCGSYWSSTYLTGIYVYYLNFTSSQTDANANERYRGLTVRPVATLN